MFLGQGVCEGAEDEGTRGHCDLAVAGVYRVRPSCVSTRLLSVRDGGTGVDVLLVSSALVVLDEELGY